MNEEEIISNQLLSIEDFAKKIKDKYPEYEGLDNAVLVNKIVEKYPEYKTVVDLKSPLEDLKKKGASMVIGGADDTVSDSDDTSVDSTETDVTITEEEPSDEIKTAFEKRFGKNGFTNLMGDIWRQWHVGRAQGKSIDESLTLFAKGENVSDEQVQNYIEAVQEMQNQPVSDEMKSFQKIYEEEGGGWSGFVKGVSNNFSVIPQLFVSSVGAMANPTVMGSGGLGFLGGNIPGAIFAATTTLETGLTFTELLQEEINKNQGVKPDGSDIKRIKIGNQEVSLAQKGNAPMTNENIRAVLEDEEAMGRIRRKAAGRGATIGMIDAVTGGVAMKVTGKTVKSLQKSKKLADAGEKIGRKGFSDLAAKTTGAVTGIGVEAGGGSLGEVAGRVVAGQPMETADILFEGVVGATSAPFTVGKALYQTPVYKINGERRSGYEVVDLLEKGTDNEIAGVEIDITNDPELLNKFKQRKQSIYQEANIRNQLQQAGITDEQQLDALTKLEVEKAKFKNNDTDAGKKKLKDIENKINSVLEGGVYVVAETVADDGTKTSNEISFTKDFAIEELKKEGIDSPSENQIQEKLQSLLKNAQKKLGITPTETTEVDVETTGTEVDDTDLDTEVDADVETDVDTEVDTEVDVETETETGVDIDTDLDTDVEVDPLESEDSTLGLEDEIYVTIQKARKGDKEAQAELEEYGINYKDPGTMYRFVSEEEVNSLKKGERVKGRFEKYVDITNDPNYEKANVKGGKQGDVYRVRYKKKNKLDTEFPNSPTREKNIQEGEFSLMGGYTLSDVDVIEQQQADGSFKVVYDSKTETTTDTDATTETETQATEETIAEEGGVKGPSAKKILGIKDTKVTVNERVALKDQIRLEAKAAREAQKDYKDKQKQVLSKISELVKKGELKSTEARALNNKIKRTNFDNTKQVDALLTYADKVFSDIDYASKENTAKSLNKRTRKKINSGRLGNNPDFNNVVSQILSTPIDELTVDNIDAYNEFLNKIAKREKVTRLDRTLQEEAEILLDNITTEVAEVESDLTYDENKGFVYTEDTQKIIDKINSPEENGQSLIDDNSEFIENDLDKVNSASLELLVDKLNLAETDANTEIVQKVNDYAKNRQSFINKIDTQAKKTNLKNLPLTSRDQEVGATTLKNISKNDLAFLSGNELKQLEIHLDNIEDGFYTHSANKLAQRIAATDRAFKMKPIVDNIKSTAAILATARSRVIAGLKNVVTEAGIGSKGAKAVGLVGQMIRSNPMYVVDQMFGNYKDNTIRENIFDPTASEYAKFQNWANEKTDKLEKVENLIAPTSKETANDSVKRRYEITTYLIQKEFEANGGKKGTASAIQFIEKTIEKYNNDPKASRYTAADIKILEQIVQEYSENNEISLKKMEAGMSKNTKKAIETLEEVYGGLAEMQSYATSIVRGQPFDLVNSYVHHKVEYNKDQNDDQLAQASEYMNIQPGTKSKTAITRTAGAKAIDFDPIATALRGLRNTGMDYFLSNEISTTRQSLTELRKITEDNARVNEAALDLKKVYNEALANVINSNMSMEVVGGSTFDNARKIGYYAALSSLPRAAGELLTNLLYATMNSPLETTLGMTKYFDMNLGEKGRMVVQNTGATVNTKLYNTEQLGGSKADQQGIVRGKRGSERAKGDVGIAAEYIGRKMGAKNIQKGIESVGEFLISTPDQMIAKPMWFGTFAKTFKDITGLEVDFNKIAAKDSEYMSQYKDAIKKSRIAADLNITRAATSNSPFSGVLKNQINKDDPFRINLYRTVNSYMSSYSLNEYATSRQSIASMAGKGQMSQIKGAATQAAVLARMTIYVVVGKILADTLFRFLGAGEDDKEVDLKELLIRQSVGAGVSLLSRGMAGNIPMIPINIGIEEINKQYGFEYGLRNDREYDPYKHSIVFAAVNADQIKRDPYKQILITASGPYTPQAKSLFRLMDLSIRSTTNKSAASREKNLKELMSLRTALEVSNIIFGVPLYRDIRSGMLREKYSKKTMDTTPMKLDDLKDLFPAEFKRLMELKKKEKK